MITDVQLIGNISIATDTSRLVANGQYSSESGVTSESIDLTAMMTASAKTSILQLVGLLNQQYQFLRQNLLSQAKCFLTDLTYLSPVMSATVAADTSTAYAGTQSAKVTTPGAAVGEGVLLALGTVPKATTATITVLVVLPQGTSVLATLSDVANTNNSYTAVSPATTPASYTKTSTPVTAATSIAGTSSWQAVSVVLPVGATNTPNLTLSITTSVKQAISFWLGAVQVVEA